MPLTLGDLHEIRELTGGHHLKSEMKPHTNTLDFRTHVAKSKSAQLASRMEQLGFARLQLSLKFTQWTKTETYGDDRFFDIRFLVSEVP